MKHEKLGRPADLGVLRVGVEAGACPRVRHEHEQARGLEGRQAPRGAARRIIPGGHVGVEDGDAFLHFVILVVRFGTGVAPVTTCFDHGTGGVGWRGCERVNITSGREQQQQSPRLYRAVARERFKLSG